MKPNFNFQSPIKCYCCRGMTTHVLRTTNLPRYLKKVIDTKTIANKYPTAESDDHTNTLCIPPQLVIISCFLFLSVSRQPGKSPSPKPEFFVCGSFTPVFSFKHTNAQLVVVLISLRSISPGRYECARVYSRERSF